MIVQRLSDGLPVVHRACEKNMKNEIGVIE